MANEFIARKGLIALSDSTVTGSLTVSGSLKVTGSVALNNIPNSSTSNVLYYNTTNGTVSYAAAGAGGNPFPFTGDVVISGSGYFNPGQVDDKRYSNSGETMFGIDRKNFKDITDESYIYFWDIIDDEKYKHPEKWTWNYNGGKIKNKLKNLAVDIMEPQFNYLFNRYLSEEAKKIIKSDYRLYFNFVYSTWNGQGWFRKFANLINEEVKNKNFDRNKLFVKLINARKNSKNSLIKQKADLVKYLANK